MSGYRPGDRVAWTRGDAAVVVARLPDGPPYVLDGGAALIWDTALDSGSEAELIARLAERADADPEVVAPDVRATLADLLELGLLVRPAPEEAAQPSSRSSRYRP